MNDVNLKESLISIRNSNIFISLCYYCSGIVTKLEMDAEVVTTSLNLSMFSDSRKSCVEINAKTSDTLNEYEKYLISIILLTVFFTF